MSNPLVSFIIATHNRGPILIDCLRRVLANGLPQSQFEILIVDNASTDGTPDLVAKEIPQATLIRLPINRGPVAKNLAIQKSKGEFIVLLDDDAYPHPGAVPQMIRHFRDDKNLAAAVFDVTLPDGSKEASAYPDVFIGAGTGLRKSVLQKVGLLPHDFFMQAEEYDLSFRILNAAREDGENYSIQRFWDLPLTHLKSPGARIGQRTTRLDVRNNLYLLAKYIPEPLCHQFAADWLARYFFMAVERDSRQPSHPTLGTHKQAYLQGAAQGLANWSAQRASGKHLLSPETLERIFKFQAIHSRMAAAIERTGARRILFADLGKNMLPYFHAAQSLHLEVRAILDNNLAGPNRDYRGIPLLPLSAAPWPDADLVIISNLSPVHAPRRAAELKRISSLPVLNLFSRQNLPLQSASAR